MAKVDAAAPRSRRGKKRTARWWYGMFLVVVGGGTIVASTVVGLLIGYINSLPAIEKLEDYNPQQVTSVYDRSGSKLIGEFASERRQVMHIDEVPDFLKAAVLAIEDDRFYTHYGVDLKSVARTLLTNREAGRHVGGASTITMQLPRNILEDVGREKRWDRKIKETFLAFQIERRYSKDQILEFYLNQIFMGRNSFGMHAAADAYFSKEPKDLTLAECATLAGIPKGPALYNPIDHPKNALRRRNGVLDRMRDLRWISPEQHDNAVAAPLVVKPGRLRSHVAHSEYPYFVDGLYRDLTKYYGFSDADVRESGFLIHSTLNERFQQIVEEELRKGLVQVERLWNDKKNKERAPKELAKNPDPPEAGQTRLMQIADVLSTGTLRVMLHDYVGVAEFPGDPPYYEPRNVLKKGAWIDMNIVKVNHKNRTVEVKPADAGPIQGSVVILDARSCEVLAMSGGSDFHDAMSNGQFNRAIMGGKPAGSTVKPFFYAAALEHGFLPCDVVVDERIVIPNRPKPYIPRNFEGKNVFFGPTTLIEGLEHSRNVTTVRLFQRVGIKRSLADVARFDYHYDDAVWREKMRREVSVCLGPVDMNALEIAAAYSVFVNQGIGKRPQFFRSITDRDGVEVRKPQTDEAIVLDPIAAFQTLYMMRQVVLGGTGKPLSKRFSAAAYPPICGKTGTTNNSTDAWFTGVTPDLVICCYVGFDTPRTMGPSMTGARVAIPIWGNIFERIFAAREDWKMQFDEPPGIEKVDIADTGKRATGGSGRGGRRVYRECPFKRGTAPRERDDGNPRDPIVGDAGANRITPGDFSEEPTSAAAASADDPDDPDDRPHHGPAQDEDE